MSSTGSWAGSGKLQPGDWCASSHPVSNGLAHALPIINVSSDDQQLKALVDTGCATTVVSSRVVGVCAGVSSMVAFDGSEVKCHGRCQLNLIISGVALVVEAVVTASLLDGVDIIVGMDVIDLMGGVTVNNGEVVFGGITSCNSVVPALSGEKIQDRDFDATFDGCHWTVRWKWNTCDLPTLTNKVARYDRGLVGEKKVQFEMEVDRWIEEGILKLWDKEVTTGIIPLMAVEQLTKNKV